MQSLMALRLLWHGMKVETLKAEIRVICGQINLRPLRLFAANEIRVHRCSSDVKQANSETLKC
jgi:hypothetical protein